VDSRAYQNHKRSLIGREEKENRGKRKIMDRLHPFEGVGVEVSGQAASLLAKTVPALQHHSSLRSGSLFMTIFQSSFQC
jgi:hypothetical protein